MMVFPPTFPFIRHHARSLIFLGRSLTWSNLQASRIRHQNGAPNGGEIAAGFPTAPVFGQ